MENQDSFSYTYSPKENQEVQNIRSKYLPREESGLDALKRLDKKVRRAPAVFACIFGSLSAIIMGCGMSLTMTDLGEALGIASPMVFGIVIGIAGIGLAALNYPIYKGMLRRRTAKFAPQILALSDKIMNAQQ